MPARGWDRSVPAWPPRRWPCSAGRRTSPFRAVWSCSSTGPPSPARCTPTSTGCRRSAPATRCAPTAAACGSREPAMPGPPDLATLAATLRAVLDHVPDLDLASRAGPASEQRLSAALRRGGLGAAACELAGRGAGLTPAGEDVLAGLLLIGRAAGGPDREARLVALARRAGTHQISRAFLESAARGRSLAAVHDLIGSCAAAEAAGARAARARLARVGHSSGLDLAYGVLVGAVNRATAPWLDAPGPDSVD